MVNKKAYVRTLEAIIAIIIIITLIYTVIPRASTPKQGTPSLVKSAQDFIASEISTNETLRYCIVGNPSCHNSPDIPGMIADNMPPGYDYVFKICDKTECVASTLPIDKSVYMSDLLVASTIQDNSPIQKPKIFRLWIWKK